MLLQDYFCCNNPCSKVGDISLSDKEIFQCRNCFQRYSIRTNSFWSKSKLSLCLLLGLLYFFCNECTVSQVLKFFDGKITKTSIIQWFNYFRDITTTYFENHPVLFAPNSVVHVDETFIGGKRKYGKGRIPKVTTRYLFGLVDRDNHKIFMRFVVKKDAAIIIPIIRQKVPDGCTINSDG